MRPIMPTTIFISFHLLLFCLLHRLTNIVLGHTQVFSMPESELNYLLDDAAHDASITSLIKFTPFKLDLGEHPIGVPFIERVVVENTQEENNIQMLSISGNTLHFHCSFFEEKIIQPKGNTSFDVVFLAREEGAVNNTLFIHTSIGSFKYQVSAVGTSNPFRLRPFIGAKVPLNSSYAPLINIFNPHSSPIQLTEIYSTGGGLHLELPNGESETDAKMWQIAPFETKVIMKANFLARSEKNHTAFIRIKTNASEEEYMVLPVEVEVTSVPGIFSPVEMLHFGVLRSHDEPKTLPLYILNSGTKHIHIQNVIATPVNDALNIEFTPMRVVPDIFHAVQVAQITLDPSKMTQCDMQCNGKIMVKSKNNQYKLAIPYQVTLLRGYLSYNETSTQFYIQPNVNAENRNLIINNHFNFSVIIHSVFLPDEAKPHFKASLLSKQVILSPNSSEEAIKISFSPKDYQLTHLETKLRIQTNISYFDVPIHAYNGKLEVFIPESFNQTVLDFGAIGLGEKKSMTFAVINNNPIVVRLKHWGCNMSKAYVELVGIGEGNASVIAKKLDLSGLSRKQITLLKPRYYAIFKLHLTGFTEEGLFYGENFVETAYERLKIPFVLRAVEGSFVTKKVFISNCFPGRISSQSVQLSSTFSHDLALKSGDIITQDERFTFELNQSLVSFGDNIVGKVYFDPIKSCNKQCYSGLEASKEVGHLWLLGLALHPDTGYIDKELHKLLYTRYNNIKDKTLNITLSLNIDGVSSLSIDVQTEFNWPKLVLKNALKFPITKMGNMTVKELIIENPSSQPLIVQAVLLSDYPNPDAIIQLFKAGFDSKWTESELISAETKPKSFQLVNLTSCEITSSHKQIKDDLGVNVDTNSISFVLPAGIRKKISIGFTPRDDSSIATTFLLLRNNLTILDAVHLQGQGGSGILKIGNQLPGMKSILTFELLEKHLKSCNKKTPQSNYAIEPTFTVHRTFTAVNVGKLAMKIRGFKIGPAGGELSSSYTCQGYGFKVINCAAFDLRPNESKKIHIAFTPDFTQSKTKQVMTILSDGPNEKLHFTLLATIPKSLLQTCNDAIPRPNWEAVLYYCLVVMMTFMILLSVCVAFFDGDRILNYTFYPVLTMHHTFDNTSLNSTPEENVEKTFNVKLLSNDVKDTKNNNNVRQRKGKAGGGKNGRSGSNAKDDSSEVGSVASWAQWFLSKRKSQRRDSSGSDRSNNSLNRVNQGNNNKTYSNTQIGRAHV